MAKGKGFDMRHGQLHNPEPWNGSNMAFSITLETHEAIHIFLDSIHQIKLQTTKTWNWRSNLPHMTFWYGILESHKQIWYSNSYGTWKFSFPILGIEWMKFIVNINA